MMKKRKRGSVDKICNLPSNIIDEILAQLPMEDVIRMSTVSKVWKDKWLTVPCVTFDWRAIQICNWESIVHYILNRHCVSIEKFTLEAEGGLVDPYDVYSWILNLSRRSSTKELSLKMVPHKTYTNFKLPPCFYSNFLELKKLVLYRFLFEPPLKCKRFAELLSLELGWVDVETSRLEYFISLCPQLEQLSLTRINFRTGGHLKVVAPNLNSFHIENRKSSITLSLSTPRLIVLHIELSPRLSKYDKDIERIFSFDGSLPSLKKLHVVGPSNLVLNDLALTPDLINNVKDSWM